MNVYKFYTIIALLILAKGCKPAYEEPKISLEGYEVEEGFEVQLVASEPLLNTPVAMDFDSKGRIWVVEMPGFMNDLVGSGENDPTGAVKILEDLDEDGIMDHSRIFLDSLVMPRALALVYGGLLYVEPPNLWFVEIENNKPGKRTLVDAQYAPEGNPEYQPNGLMLNIDNWIYNAKLQFRYQLKNGEWLKEPTTNRGQWGISHDNFGRLYYNNNSRQLIGDYVLPNRLVRNTNYIPKYGVNRILTDDQRVYPLHAASVNRGYAEGVLTKDSLLTEVSATCGPLVYRGGNFPEGYDQNVFVCVPEANLIKRNILSFHGDSTSAKQAWQNKEFLATTDEGFRPVSLNNGPDGSMYVIDMHLGVIQHYAFLSPYLKQQAEKKKLDTLVGFGRILKIKDKKNKPLERPDFETLSGSELVGLLKDKNGWIRDRAQQYLIFKNLMETVPALEKLATSQNNPLAQIHALYTLKGMETLSFDILKAVALKSSSDVISHTIVLLEDFCSEENTLEAKSLFQELLAKNDRSIDLYLASTLGIWAKVSHDEFFPLIDQLVKSNKKEHIINEALLSGMGETGEAFLANLEQGQNLKDSNLVTGLTESIERKKANKPNPIFSNAVAKVDTRTNGAKLFRQICAACHGITGEGIDELAPPLINSEFVSKSAEQLGLIILHGLKGPIHVNGKLYEMNHVMPGLIANESLSDKDISDVISYVTNAFSDKPKGINAKKIKELRDEKSKSGAEYTEKELLEFATENP